MAPVNFGNALNSIGSFQSSLQGYIGYALAAFVLVAGIVLTISKVFSKTEPKPDEAGPLSIAAFTVCIALLFFLLARWQLKMAQSTTPFARSFRQVGALSSFLPSPFDD